MSSLYQSSSFNEAGVTRPYAQIPKTPDFSNVFNKVTAPAAGVVQEAPNSVILNNAGSYKFCYTTSASLAGSTLDPTDYISGSVLDGDSGPIELPIQPVAWSAGGAAAKTGDVTFVYKGVK